MIGRSLLLVLCSLVVPLILSGAESRTASGRVVPFRLLDTSGNTVDIDVSARQQLTVVCFLGTECPLARQYAPRLNKLALEYATKNVRFIAINSNSQDSPKEVAEFAREFALTFPLLKDPGNKAADQFGARTISEVFVLDESLMIRYHGRIDDQYAPGAARPQPTRNDLQAAIDELLTGKPVSVPQTDAAGCAIGRVRTPDEKSDFTFCNQVARVLNRHCVECHRPGEIGPFSLTDYDEVVGWGETILETVDAARMPPWNANPKVGHFRNARVMSDEDKRTLREWVKAGMPYGNVADLPPAEQFSSGWQLPREPELVLKMRDRPFKIPATGAVEYQYFVVDPHFDEDRWVSAAQIIPGSRATVHHCIVFIRPPDGTDVRGVGYLTGYVPGQRSYSLPPGYARKVPAGSKFVFQMHYTPNGAEQEDLTQLGMTFIPESQMTHEVFTLLGIDQEFEIPPYAADFPVNGNVGWFPRRAELLAIVPHMHVRGKAFQAMARTGEKRELLLDVTRYDFNWQHVYELSQPIKLADIDKLEFTARFDNSVKNPANPDPSQTVTWGDQTWEEMAVAFFEVSEPRDVPAEPEPQRNKKRLIVKTESEKSDPESGEPQSVEKFVDDFFQRFDKNRDKIVESLETPLGFRRFGFYQYDTNRDGKLTREEVQAAAMNRRKR